MRHKKLAIFLLALIMVLALAVAVACNPTTPPDSNGDNGSGNGEGDQHEHSFAKSWTTDSTHHWHAATCGHSTLTSDKDVHDFDDNGKCTVCEYVKGTTPHSHTFDKDWTTDESYHWHAANCGHTDEIDGKDAHDFDDNGKCTVCEYVLVSCKVKFDTNGGSEIASLSSVTKGTKISKPATPTKNDCTFGGWYKDALFLHEWSFDSDTVNTNITLHAKWLEATKGLTYELSEDGTSYTITGMDNTTASELVIPNTHDNKPVTAIGEQAFRQKENLTSVVFGEGSKIDTVGRLAFASSSNLQAVYISDLFAWCKITFGAGNANPLAYAGDLYLNGQLLTNLVIPEGITEINTYAFVKCTSITSLTIPESVAAIGNAPFTGCSNLQTVYWNATNCTQSGSSSSSAFSNCTSLTKVVIGEKVEELPNYAFYNCESLQTLTFEGNSQLKRVGRSALTGCTNLEYLTYSNAKYLGNDVNPYVILVSATDRSITSVDIGSTTRCIYQSAFAECGSLTSIAIPTSVKFVGLSAFYNCNKLTKVHITDIAAWCDIEFDESTSSSERTTNPTHFSRNLYINDKIVNDVVIPDGVTEIKQYAFDNCFNLRTITLPTSIKTIGQGAFSGCTSLAKVYISDLKAWCEIDFEDYYSNPMNRAQLYVNNSVVTKLEIPQGITEIKPNAFTSCLSITSVSIPSAVTKIGKAAFENCTNLTTVTFGENSQLATIDELAFGICTSLKTITIPSSVTMIEREAFRKCTALTSINIPSNVTLNYRVFYECDNLTSATFEATSNWVAEQSVWSSSEGWNTITQNLSASDISNKSTAARYLRDTYNNYTWSRKS